jgi:hypothetical protein
MPKYARPVRNVFLNKRAKDIGQAAGLVPKCLSRLLKKEEVLDV